MCASGLAVSLTYFLAPTLFSTIDRTPEGPPAGAEWVCGWRPNHAALSAMKDLLALMPANAKLSQESSSKTAKSSDGSSAKSAKSDDGPAKSAKSEWEGIGMWSKSAKSDGGSASKSAKSEWEGVGGSAKSSKSGTTSAEGFGKTGKGAKGSKSGDGTPVPTSAPTQSPTSAPVTREEAIRQLILDATEDPALEALLDDPTSPEAQAFVWLLNDPIDPPLDPNEGAISSIADPTSFDPSEAMKPGATRHLQNESCARGRSGLIQRWSLVVLYFSLNGANWRDNTGWLTGADACTWYGIFGLCDVNSCATYFDLSDNRVDGSLRSSIGNLNKLGELFYGHTARLKAAITSLCIVVHILFFLPSTEELRLVGGDNLMTGPIPDSIGRLSALSKFCCKKRDDT